ncbi:hypothetical protein GCM10008023_36870 [Sphingomonas glacialis]|uniref:Xylulose 5-phosphate/Fructose 6-phosphate phosphoketolase N-terminal domain-containing protein n=1 Tax=Sphingomonas glacialis TaxID=658225 RepID=A0ABQ3LYE5_9SPHN|nr:hypothetical protein [Sphingomonas glacialis]GHH24611.1 hypothetical protein GCM10008023_36870 [Sphingomonas glacialis]
MDAHAIERVPPSLVDVSSSVAKSYLGSEERRLTNAYWRAANYLSVGQIYLYDNPLLQEPLKLAHVKPLIVGHWGTTPDKISSTSILTV